MPDIRCVSFGRITQQILLSQRGNGTTANATLLTFEKLVAIPPVEMMPHLRALDMLFFAQLC